MKNLENFSTRLPEDMKLGLKVIAAQRKTSVQEIVIEAIKQWIDNNNNEGVK